MAHVEEVYTCDECRRVVARRQDGHLVVEHVHDRQVHSTTIDAPRPDAKAQTNGSRPAHNGHAIDSQRGRVL